MYKHDKYNEKISMNSDRKNKISENEVTKLPKILYVEVAYYCCNNWLLKKGTTSCAFDDNEN